MKKILFEIYKALEKPNQSRYGVIVQNTILAIIVVNIFVSFSSHLFSFSDTIVYLFGIIEYVTVVFFLFELSLRYITIGHNTRYSGIKGRLIFTWTPFILIDIVSLLPYLITGVQADLVIARAVRFLRFLKVFKLLRMKNVIKKFFSIGAFVTSSIWAQIFVLLLLSMSIVSMFSFVYSGDDTSLNIFLGPGAIVSAKGAIETSFGILELLLGLIIGGALISIITGLMSSITNNVKNGFHPYRGKNHIVIINQNQKLEFILKEISYYYEESEQIQDVVIFLPFVDNIEVFKQGLRKYPNLEIVLIAGDELNWNSYKKTNINYARKILMLKDESKKVQNLNIKIAKFLTTHKNFTNKDIQFVIETQRGAYYDDVYDKIFEPTSLTYTLVEHNEIMQQFLNHSIIEPYYFKIFLNLLSFKDYDFYRIKASKVVDKNTTFEHAYMALGNGVLIGIRRHKDNYKLMLNPPLDTPIHPNDELVLLLKSELEYRLKKRKIPNTKSIKIVKPTLKSTQKICIVGTDEIIKIEEIGKFLTQDSIDSIQYKATKDGNYIDQVFWDDIIKSNYDIVILNLEDDLEFMLSLFLKSTFKNNEKFLKSIVNIIHSPIIARLLKGKDTQSNIILSEKLVGEYITQAMFNHKIVDVFDEITQPYGSEFYLLSIDKYAQLFDMTFYELKTNLIKHNMIYIGVIKNAEFIPNYKNFDDKNGMEHIVVLTQGY